jgi:uncharacterized protein YcnI
MKKNIVIATSAIVALLVSVVPTFAHVVVKPDTVGVAARQVFTVGVPNEKDNPTIALRLIIPQGLKSVTPNVKPGWTIDVKKTGDGEDAKVTEIDWSDGSIPVGQRDEFYFQAQVPSSETTLNWKAYQTYSDGTIVSWDQNPDSMKNLSDEQQEANEQKGLGPYSQTKIVNDLTTANNSTQNSSSQSNNLSQTGSLSMLLSIAAIALSGVAFVLATKKK